MNHVHNLLHREDGAVEPLVRGGVVGAVVKVVVVSCEDVPPNHMMGEHEVAFEQRQKLAETVVPYMAQ